MEVLNIRLMGGFLIKRNDEPIIGLDSFKLQTFLSYIFLYPLIPHSKRKIAFLFWPESSENQAMANLRLMLFRLRKSNSEIDQYIDIRSHTIQARDSQLSLVDVHEFEKYTAYRHSISDLTKAYQLYAGDLLPGHYDDWILEERNRLQSLFIQTVESLIDCCELDRDYPKAIFYVQRLIENDPVNEKSYRRAMTLYALNHDRAAAISIYHRCVETLKQELNVDPEKETKEMYELLVSGESRPAIPGLALGFPLVGRKGEWRQMENAWSAVLRHHASGMVLLVGDAGIGKTRLAEEMVQWISKQGIAYAVARCYPAEGSVAFTPLTTWLRSRPLNLSKDPWLVEISRLLPEIQTQRPDFPAPRPLQENWQRQTFFEAIANVILGDRRPLLLWIDDLHWCDRDTIEWLHFFLRSKPDERVLILGTARAEEIENNPSLNTLLSALNNGSLLTRITLNPMDAEDTAALGEYIAGRPIDLSQAEVLYEESEGNPLFIVELMRARLELMQQDQKTEEAPFTEDRGLPARIQQVINDRLRLVPAPAYELAELASVLGSSFLYSLLFAASDLREGVLVDLLDILWRRGIIRERGPSTYAFSHEKIREVIYAGLSQARKRLLHRRAAETIESLQQGQLEFASSQLAYHYDRAGVAARAVEFYLLSARYATQLLSNADVLAALQQGLGLLVSLPESRERDLIELSYQLALGAAHLARQIRAPEVRQAYARAYFLAQKSGTDFEQFAALKGLWEYDNYWLSLNQARELGENMLQIARGVNNTEMKAAAHYSMGTTAFLSGNYETSRSHLEEGLRLLESIPISGEYVHGPHPRVGCRTRLAWTLCFLGYTDQAFVLADEGVQIAQDLGQPFSKCSALVLETLLLLMFRKDRPAGLLAEQAIALSEQYDYRFWTNAARRMYGWATVQQGPANALQAVLDRENQEWHRVHAQKPAVWFTLSQSLYINGLAASGRVGEGLERLDALLGKLENSPEMMWKPELYRIKGSFLLQSGCEPGEVEYWFLQAVQLAHQQRSRLLELRALVSLLQLRSTLKKGPPLTENVLWLKTLLDWFPESADLPDIQDARALLASIH